jgi:HK97 gp10 family phage protein
MSLQMQGMSELMRSIQEMGRIIDSQVTKKALKKSAELVKDKIEETVPVRTGNLKRNIVISEIEDDKIHIGPDQQGDAFYGHFLEFGTSKAAAKPFMGPVFENNKDAIQETMTDVIKRELGL